MRLRRCLPVLFGILALPGAPLAAQPPRKPAPRPARPPAAVSTRPQVLALLDTVRAWAVKDIRGGGYYRDAQFRVVARSYIRLGEYDLARATVAGFQSRLSGGDVLGELAVALVRAGLEARGEALLDSLGNPMAQHRGLLNLAAHHAAAGHTDRARALFARAAAIRLPGLSLEALPALHALGDSAAERDTLLRLIAESSPSAASDAAARLMEALDSLGYRDLVKRQLDAWYPQATRVYDRQPRIFQLTRLANLYLMIGAWREATEAAIQSFDHSYLAILADTLAKHGAEARHFEHALANLREPGDEGYRRDVLLSLAEVHARAGRKAESDSAFATAVAVAAPHRDDWWQRAALMWSGIGDSARAAAAVGQLQDSATVAWVRARLLIDRYPRSPAPNLARAVTAGVEASTGMSWRFDLIRSAAHALALGGDCRSAMALALRYFGGVAIQDNDLAPLLDRCGRP